MGVVRVCNHSYFYHVLLCLARPLNTFSLAFLLKTKLYYSSTLIKFCSYDLTKLYISDNLTTDKSQNLRPEEAVENGNLSSSFYTIGLTSIAEFCLINYHVLSVLVAVLFIFQGNCGA